MTINNFNNPNMMDFGRNKVAGTLKEFKLRTFYVHHKKF